jgi:NAD(P)-dependent dehydrogenase (short-subunit alcohol dehydrogenase family)
VSDETYPELEAAKAHWRYRPAAGTLDGKTVLVTGAGAGIGATTAKTLATYGADVVLLGRTHSKLEQIFDWITTHTPTNPVIVPADLTLLSTESVAALFDAVHTGYGKLDGLVHNASLLALSEDGASLARNVARGGGLSVPASLQMNFELGGGEFLRTSLRLMTPGLFCFHYVRVFLLPFAVFGDSLEIPEPVVSTG